MRLIKVILFFCLISFSFGNVFITPTYPPTAFQNQFYSVVFRIRGADFPVFRFSGLPSGIVGRNNGTVSGIPTVAGSFSVNLSYVAGGQSGSRTFILSVTADNLRRSSDSVISVRTSTNLMILVPQSLVFRAWQRVQLKFQAQSGQQPYLWTFNNVPKGLVGNTKTGLVSGVPREEGYYVIHLQVADRVGKSASAYVTLNVQPQARSESSQFFIQGSKSLVQVMLQNPQTLTDVEYVKFVQEYAAEDLKQAEIELQKKRQNVNKFGAAKDMANYKFERSNSTYFLAERELILVKDGLRSAQLAVTTSQRDLQNAVRALNLSMNNLNISNLRVRQSQSSVNGANRRVNEAQRSVNSSEETHQNALALFMKSQNMLKSSNQTKQNRSQDYKTISQELQTQNQQLQNHKRQKQLADVKSTTLKDALLLVQQARDNAEIQITKIQFALKQTQNWLALRLEKMSFIRNQFAKTQRQLNSLQIDYQLKLNLLFLAQTRKQAADRATAIALAETTLSNHNPEDQKRIFGQKNAIGSASLVLDTNPQFLGCNHSNYPPISGVSQAIRFSLESKTLTLTSGRLVIYGDCTSAQPIKAGDWVKFQGYIVGTIVHALKVQKTSLA